MLCPNCGEENPEGFRFCGHCSTVLDAESDGRDEVRKTVTVLFCDVTGSTTLGERLDPETVRRVMRRYFDEMRAVLEAHGGTVEKFIGDAVMAVFGVPTVHEDDALRAVRAAQEMRERLGRLNKELERDYGVSIVARTGVNTGEVVAGTSAQTLATGDAVNVAARLEQAAEPGAILIGADTRALVRDAIEAEPVDPLEVKGKAEPVRAFRLVSVEGAEGLMRRFDMPMVGRADELSDVGDALRRAERDAACVLVTVLGPAGVGKSRLVQEFVEREGASATIVRGRCLPYGDGITYWPVVEMLTATAEIGDVDAPDEVRAKILRPLADVPDAELVAERLAHLLGIAGASAAPEETHWAVRKLLEAMAVSAPLVAVFDDLHWAEPTLLDLVEHVADWSRDAPILLLCTARPELLDRRPNWGGGKLNATTFLLEPLSDAECDELVANLLDRAELPEPARRTITEAAEGNPLFVEHMVAMLVDDGLLRRRGERWVVEGDLSRVTPPASIMALLEARLERLSPQERAVIERASIEGKQFHVGSVRALSAEGATVREPLMALVRRDLIRPDRALIAGDDSFRFRHILVRDAAYHRIPKETRSELHERHAGWLEEVAVDQLAEFGEIVGFHLEQAYRLRAELGPLDADAGALASRAADHLIASGRRAAERGDVRASASLLAKAIELLPADHPDRPKLLTDLSIELAHSGEADRARDAVEEAEALLGSEPGPAIEFAVRFARLELDSAMEPEGVAVRMREEAERAIPRLEAIGDDAGLARAWHLLGQADNFRVNFAGMLAASLRGLDHAERAGDRTEATSAVIWGMIATAYGMTRPEEGLPSIDALARRAPDNLDVTAWAQINRGLFLAMLGQIDEGRELLRAGRTTIEDLGLALSLGGSSQAAGFLEEIAGDLEANERELRQGYDLLAAVGEKSFLSSVAGLLAISLTRGDRLDEAEEISSVSEETAATDDVLSQATWRQARALVAAKRGQPDQALGLIQEAVALLDASDVCDLRGRAFEDLAEVHRLAGRVDGAAEAFERAIDVWDRKGADFVADRLRARLVELRPA